MNLLLYLDSKTLLARMSGEPVPERYTSPWFGVRPPVLPDSLYEDLDRQAAEDDADAAHALADEWLDEWLPAFAVAAD